MATELDPSFEPRDPIAAPALAGRDRRGVVVGAQPLTIEDLVAIAEGRKTVALSDDPGFAARIEQAHSAVARLRRSGEAFYGVTTGVGASVDNSIPESLQAVMPQNLVRFHGVGTGRILDETEAAATVAARLVSLARGFSGVRPVLLELMCSFLNLRLLPRIPAEGSVGASGDLTPLSYLAAALTGEREMTLRGEERSAADALAACALEPLVLEPKESLAVMNGTSMMTGLGCLAFARAERVARAACAITAVASDVTHGNPTHFDARIAAARPHPGQVLATRWIREDLRRDGPAPRVARVQDRYSLRCAPQVIGVLLDALRHGREILETELNAVNDNPLIDPDTGEALHGGNFYGGHVCFAMDGLKAALASTADLIDRQLVLMCNPETSDGLPENLVAVTGPERVAHHGFKAMQITASALTAEALKLAAPASAFSRSTESHNQDKVSMGSIAVRECLRIVELCETVVAILVLSVVQAADLRGAGANAQRTRALHHAVRKAVAANTADRRQDHDIARVLAMLRADELPVGARGAGRPSDGATAAAESA